MFQFRNCFVAISPDSAQGSEQLMKLWSQYGLGSLYQKATGKVETDCSSRYDLIWVCLQTGF